MRTSDQKEVIFQFSLRPSPTRQCKRKIKDDKTISMVKEGLSQTKGIKGRNIIATNVATSFQEGETLKCIVCQNMRKKNNLISAIIFVSYAFNSGQPFGNEITIVATVSISQNPAKCVVSKQLGNNSLLHTLSIFMEEIRV